MDFLVNDLSIHGQFHEKSAFRDALARLMTMRSVAQRFGRELHCHRALLNRNPMPHMTMQQTLGQLTNNERRAAMGWLTRHGPFWEDLRQHAENEYLECRGEIVTDSAVGEAAFRTTHSVECGLVSITPSDWDYSPLEVIWRREDEGLEDQHTHVGNWRDEVTLEEKLRLVAPKIESWDKLRETSTRRFMHLTFSGDCFEPLHGLPFAQSTADRIVVLLGILDQLTRELDENDERTLEGQQIYQKYFTGSKTALFSDSSDDEKSSFRNQLTFPHPNAPGESLFCPWHGKERHMTLRLHFSWPIKFGKPVYVVYVGPKITKR